MFFDRSSCSVLLRDSLKLFPVSSTKKQQRQLGSTAPDNALLVLLHRCWDHSLSSFGSSFLAACLLSVGRNSPVLCAGGVLFPCKMTPFLPHLTSPRLFFVEYLYYYVRWCASLQPPTICAKSSSAYNA
jgi:hypothetical protein